MTDNSDLTDFIKKLNDHGFQEYYRKFKQELEGYSKTLQNYVKRLEERIIEQGVIISDLGKYIDMLINEDFTFDEWMSILQAVNDSIDENNDEETIKLAQKIRRHTHKRFALNQE